MRTAGIRTNAKCIKENVFNIVGKKLEYSLVFQNQLYEKEDFEKFHGEESQGEMLEFLPGIFYDIRTEYPVLINIIIQFMSCYENVENGMMPLLLKLIKKSFSKESMIIEFKNKRDDYSFRIGEQELYKNEKCFVGKGDDVFDYEYEPIDRKPVYQEVLTEKIIYPCGTGGDGKRCRLKGVFTAEQIYEGTYEFFSEYEMHCLTKYSEEIRKICKRCEPCMKTVEMMKGGLFVGPTKGNDDDCLTLSEKDGKYIIENGNHRACCAKAFGVPVVKAKIYKYRRTVKKEIKKVDKTNGTLTIGKYWKAFIVFSMKRELNTLWLESIWKKMEQI